jgi:anti-sigma factor RsiW
MAKITRLSGEERENLVAYLDGELDPQQIREIELALGRSPVARHDVDMLARTWDLLDNLPQQQVGEQFVTETMSLVIGAEVGGEEVDPLAPLKARNRTLWWSFAVGLVSLALRLRNCGRTRQVPRGRGCRVSAEAGRNQGIRRPGGTACQPLTW